MSNISQAILVRSNSNLCWKELTVHWSAPNSLIRSYLQPCTNSMWGDESGAVALIIPDFGCPKGGSFLSRSSHNSPETWQIHDDSACHESRNDKIVSLIRFMVFVIQTLANLLTAYCYIRIPAFIYHTLMYFSIHEFVEKANVITAASQFNMTIDFNRNCQPREILVQLSARNDIYYSDFLLLSLHIFWMHQLSKTYWQTFFNSSRC